MSPSQEIPVWTVTTLNEAVRELLEGTFLPVRVAGEISGMTLHRSGHVYLTLKDETSQIRGVFFGGADRCRQMGLKDGDSVEADARISFYARRGECQLNITSLRPMGTGSLQQKFEEMKQRLAQEGLFDASRKKPLPFIPRCIGIVTSPEGAAIKDFIKVALERFPPLRIRVFPAPVQGKGAEEILAEGIDFFNHPAVKGVDVILVTRGGGSLEDLWPFNEEVLARAVARSRKPVVSAVGHEIDTTICDLAADVRCPTPTAAAETILPDLTGITESLDWMRRHLRDALSLRVQQAELHLQQLVHSRALTRPGQILMERSQTIDLLLKDMESCLEKSFIQSENRLEQLGNSLKTLNPRWPLDRGYSILMDRKGKAVKQPSQAPEGTELTALLAGGALKLISQGEKTS